MCLAAISPVAALAKGKLNPMTAVSPSLGLLMGNKKKPTITGPSPSYGGY